MCQLSLSLRKQPQAASGAAHLGVTGVLTAFTPIVAGRPTSAGLGRGRCEAKAAGVSQVVSLKKLKLKLLQLHRHFRLPVWQLPR